MMRHASNDDDEGGGDGEYCNDYYKKLMMITDIDEYICHIYTVSPKPQSLYKNDDLNFS